MSARRRYNALVAELEQLHPPTCLCSHQVGPPRCAEGPADEERLAAAFIAMPLWARAWTLARVGLWCDAIYEIRHNTTSARAYYAQLLDDFSAAHGPEADPFEAEEIRAAFDAMPRWARMRECYWVDAIYEFRRST